MVRRFAEQPGAAAPPAAAGPPPGWYGDPSGPGHRYWDGVRWTSLDQSARISTARTLTVHFMPSS
nr:DUF2510 domain-containing protein [Mycobacterium sp. 852014-50255_SCH5639931]